MKSKKAISSELLFPDPDSLPPPKHHYTRHQWLIFFIFIIINLGAGMCYSILAPFYPEEAESRGVSSAVYGFVFGCFELVNFLVCPLFGRYIRTIGVKFMLNAGNFTLGICTVLFGFIDKMPDRTTFIAFSFIIRIIEALGQSGSLTANYAIVAEKFSDQIATFFSILETAFAVGMIMGPTVGAILLEAGGFGCPFFVIGAILCAISIVVSFIIPSIEIPEHKPSSVLKFLSIPSVAIAFFASIATSFGTAFIFALIEPHLKQFHLSVIDVGAVMAVNGVTYAISAPFWGFISDRYCHPKFWCGLNAIFVTISFLFIGPAPFFPFSPLLWLIIISLVIQGIGAAGEFVVGFIDAIQEATAHGYPEDIETYAMISGLWLSGFALGSFIGPSLSGILQDLIGFRKASMLVVIMHIILAILCFGYYWIIKYKITNSNLSRKHSFLNGHTITSQSEILPLKAINVIQ